LRRPNFAGFPRPNLSKPAVKRQAKYVPETSRQSGRSVLLKIAQKNRLTSFRADFRAREATRQGECGARNRGCGLDFVRVLFCNFRGSSWFNLRRFWRGRLGEDSTQPAAAAVA
jgi:hypothetical protein